MGRFSFSSLRIRLLLLVLLAVIPALGLILYTGLEQRRQAVVEAQKTAQRLIRLFSVEQERLVEGAHHIPTGEFQIGRVTKKPTLNLGYPVLDEEGRVQAVVFVALDLAWLNELAAKAQLPSGSVLTVVDHKGTILARYPDHEKWVGQSMPEAPIVRAMLAQREGTAEVAGLDGVSRLFAFTPLHSGPAGDVTSAVGIPKEAAFAEVNRMLARNLSWLGLVTVLALAAAWFGGDLFIRRRVNALVAATKGLAGGDLSTRIGPISGQGELDHLARAFDEMAAGLERQVAQRKQAEDAMRQQLSPTSLLNQITPAIADRQDLESIFRILLRRLEDDLPAALGMVFLYDEKSDVLTAAAARQRTRPLAAAMSLPKGATLPVDQTGLRAGAELPRKLAEHSLGSMIVTPLSAEGKTFGMLVLARPEERGFSSTEGEFLRSLSEHVAFAAHQIRLHENLQRAYEDLRETQQAV